MKLEFVFIISSFCSVYSNINNEFIIDYFKYKRTSSVIGFSRKYPKDDLLLLKDFSKSGIKAALLKLNKLSNVQKFGNTNYWKLGIFIDIRDQDVDSITSVFIEASDNRMFDELRCWLILSVDLMSTLDIIDDRAFGLPTDFIIAVYSSSENYELYDAYNIMKSRGSSINVTFFGYWNREDGLKVILTQTKLARRWNLNKLILKATFFKSAYRPPNIELNEYYEDVANATKDANSKFGFHILSHLADLYNFSLVAYEASNWKRGDPVGPLVQALLNNSADFTGTALFMTIKRSYYLRFVHQSWPFRTCFIFRNPQPGGIKFQEILQPLRNEVWCLMFLLIVISVVLLAIILRTEMEGNIVFSFSNSILLIIGAMCQQGTDMKLNNASARIAFIFIMIFSLLIYNYYSASVVSVRLDSPIFKINDSLSEFGKIGLKMSSEWMDYLEFFLKKPDWESRVFYENYWLKLPESMRYMIPETGIRRVQKGGFAYHTHPDIAYPIIERQFSHREICELMEVHVANPIYTCFGVSINSSIDEISRVGLMKISETGLRHRQVLRWQYRKPQCYKDILSASSINIFEFAPHLVLLLMGMVIAFGIYAIEVMITEHTIHRLKLQMSHNVDANSQESIEK